MVGLKLKVPNLELMLAWMASTKTCTEVELCGVGRWFICLRLADREVQFPAAQEVVKFMGRLAREDMHLARWWWWPHH